MAQIELRIIASTPDELQDILAGLADGSIQPEVTGVTGSTTVESAGKRGRGRPKGSKNKDSETAPATPSAPAPEAPPATQPAPAPETSTPPAPAASPSDGVRTALVAVIEKFGENGAAKAQAILKDVGGAENITSLDPSKYVAVIAAAQAAVATTTSLLD